MIDLNLIVRAKKDGKMEDGRYFCYKYETYHAAILDGDEDDDGGDFYYVEDENEDGKYELHGMDKEFFDEYFVAMTF